MGKSSKLFFPTRMMLINQKFPRAHRSVLVNLNEVERYVRGDGGYLMMSDGKMIDVSRGKKEELLKKLLR